MNFGLHDYTKVANVVQCTKSTENLPNMRHKTVTHHSNRNIEKIGHSSDAMFCEEHGLSDSIA